MSRTEINNELEKAFRQKNTEKIRALLFARADPRCEKERSKDTILYDYISVDNIKECNVSALDFFYETPLHCYVKENRDFESIRELLRNGAYVNMTDRKGNTALSIALKKHHPNLKILKELLLYGADINIRDRDRKSLFGAYHTPLKNAIHNHPECAKLLIKYFLIRNYCDDYKKIINLNYYKHLICHSEMASYLDECNREILQMKTDKMKDGLSLYEFIRNNLPPTNNRLYNDSLSMRLSNNDYSVKYPIYNDVILDIMKPFLEREILLNRLSQCNMQFYIRMTDNFESDYGKEKKINLNYDVAYGISEYLCNEDLANFIEAFDNLNKFTVQSSNLSNDVLQLNEVNETFASNVSKRPRLSQL